MTAARLTATEARALGIDAPASTARRSRRVAAGAYLTRCHTCDTVCPSQAAEDRHLAATGHCRYDLSLTAERP